MDELIIIRSSIMLRSDYAERLRQEIISQRKDGVILVPPHFEVIRAPADVEVRVEDCNGKSLG